VKFHALPALDMCTYYGVDNGGSPLQLSLFLDIIASTASDATEEEYLASTANVPARKVLWKHMRGLPLHAVVATAQGGARYSYLSSAKEYISSLSREVRLPNTLNTAIRQGAKANVEKGSILEDSALLGTVSLSVGSGSLVSGLHAAGSGTIEIPSGSISSSLIAISLVIYTSLT